MLQLKTIDILVIIFTLSSFILILGSTLSPPNIQHLFTDILSIDTLSQFGEYVTLNTRGQCHLGGSRGSCVDIISTVLAGHFTGYESEETDYQVYKDGLKVVWLQKMIFATHQIFHGILLVACYALLCFAWEDTSSSSSSSDVESEPTTLRPLKRFAVITMCLSTLAGTVATVTGLAISISLSNMLQDSLGGMDDIRVGSGWVITLAATLGCLLMSEKVAELVLDPEREGRIALPTDEESSNPRAEDTEARGEKSTFFKLDDSGSNGSVPLILE